MTQHTLSERLRVIVDALPLREGMRVLEIGCGPGTAAREVARRIGKGYVLGIDRSLKAIGQAAKSGEEHVRSGRLEFRQARIEQCTLAEGELPYDIAFAVRVGALDGRHPAIERQALACIANMLTPAGKLFIDGGDPLKEIPLAAFRQAQK